MELPVLIDSASGQPVYQQIASQLARRIRDGEIVPGERLPAIRRLAAELGLHRDTVALAYEHLATEGWVEARVGSGTFARASAKNVAAAIVPIRGAEAEHDENAELVLSSQVDRLIGLENTRPRYATGDDVIALHKLIPDPQFYPVDEFRACLDQVFQEEGPELFSYASPEGDPSLRRVMAERFRNVGVDRGADEIVLCHGASQGISLALRLFAEPGDQVAVEVPTYANVLTAFAGLGLEAAAVAMDEEGPELESLDRVLARPEVKAFYTIPSFHNPLGTTTSLARRHQIIEIAKRHRVPIIEDGFEMDLRWRGEEIPPLAALDETGIVVLLFSFSKSLFPGLRVGSISAEGRALEGLVALKHATDLSDALPIQAALARFVESGAYDAHLHRIRGIMRSRHEAMAEALEAEMPEGTLWTRPDGGYQLWVELPFEVDTRDLLPDAARAGVLFSPGSLFLPGGGPSHAMRLTVSCADEREIRRGIKALGQLVKERHAVEPGSGRVAGVHL